ncbi:MAG TPA: NUDIX hydrolase [Rhodobacteraceae bacterium]|jgi:8-oxo-dGTP pyrophosphatase MutT (NUDIX family)|nr:NUDIX hydrolase [Paracoccaceae bacterium]HBV55619.1 NUDIX hydrolase [Paracoccaceae bacterium]
MVRPWWKYSPQSEREAAQLPKPEARVPTLGTLINLGLIRPPVSAPSTDEAQQFAALCWREKSGKIEVLMVTSRGTGRWIIPKGWRVPGKSARDSALIEAWEEAGVEGRAAPEAIGSFSYMKMIGAKTLRPLRAEVYAVKVKSLAKRWPEAGERKRKWMSPKKAAHKVVEPELAALLRGFAPEGVTASRHTPGVGNA